MNVSSCITSLRLASLLLLAAMLVLDCAAASGQQAASAPANVAAEPFAGYNLFSIEQTAYLCDMDGEVVHTWTVAEGAVKTTPFLLADGSVLFPLSKRDYTFRPGGAHGSGHFQRVSWDGELLWDFTFFGEDYTPSYDVEPMPNGNVLLCVSVEDRSLPGKLIEIEPIGTDGGTIVWECDVTAKLGGEVKGYINSVSYNADTDQVLVNIQRPGHTLAIFDHSSPDAELIFKWDERFSGRIHGGVWITDNHIGTDLDIEGADVEAMRVGNIITASNDDNELVEIDPRTNKVVQVFSYELADHQSGVQRLPNGNTLVVSGYSTTIDELDAEGKVVWTMETPDRISRAYRYGVGHPGLARLLR